MTVIIMVRTFSSLLFLFKKHGGLFKAGVFVKPALISFLKRISKSTPKQQRTQIGFICFTNFLLKKMQEICVWKGDPTHEKFI